MASAAILGSAAIEYSTAAGSTTRHTLAAPLRELAPVKRTTRHVAWSLDHTAREVVTVVSTSTGGSGGVEEITATIRWEDQPGNLQTLLNYGLDDYTLTYIPATGSSGTNYPCKLVEIVGASEGEAALRPDRDRFAFGEYETTIRLRRVDGGSFSALLS